MLKSATCLCLALTALAGAKPLEKTKLEQAAARIDQLIEADLRTANLRPMPLIDDATFLRRAYLGIVGRIPTVEEARAFLDERSSTKREDLVDSLVGSPGFDSHLFNWTADLLRLQTRQEQFGLGWHVWLRQSLAEDKPWDELVNEMLSSSGHCATDPAVGYYLRDRNMQLDNFSNTMSVFLGRQIGCAQCHDHPFDDWSQYDYYQMAAFGGGFQYRSQEAAQTVQRVAMETLKQNPGKVGNAPPADDQQLGPKQFKEQQRKRLKQQTLQRQNQQQFRNISRQFQPLFKDFNKNAIFDNPKEFLELPEDYQYKDGKPGEQVEPETLFGEKLKNVAPEQRRDAFAEWVTSPDNPYFTQVIANRMWARTFGYGLVEPINDWKSDTSPSHPEVMDFLETAMQGVDYDLRQFLRILYRTELFQRECLPEEPTMGMPLAFRGPVLTRMSAEQLFDSFIVLTQQKIDDSPSSQLGQSWTAYGQQVTQLMEAESHQLVILAEAAKQGEAALREAQSKVRDAQQAIAKATTPAAKQEAEKAAREAREQFVAARRSADPLRSAGMEMSMGMQMNQQSREKSGNARASEHPTPFNPSTIVREFGGSDRSIPSSGHTTATVPQALALLNGFKTDIVSGKKSILFRDLLRLQSPADRVDLLFLTLYSRPADAADHQHYDKLAGDPVAARDLARAMVTSKRFLFVQ